MIQLQFLNYLLSSKDASTLIEHNINEEFFSDYVDEYRYIKEHLDTYGTIPDQVSFLNKFPHFDIVEVHEPVPYLIESLYKDRNTRRIIETFNNVSKLVKEDKIDEVSHILSDFAEAYNNTSKSIEAVDILRDTSRYDAYVERCSDFDKYFIKTGFKELDDIIGGWDRNEELATIVARSNMGKSWLLIKFAQAAVEQGLRCGFYSGEMSYNKVGYRFDTLLSHISNKSLTKGNIEVQNDYKRFLDNLPGRFSGCLKVLTPVMLGGSAGVSDLRAFVERENLDILFIDQHSLLEDDRKARTPVEKASNISKDLKNLQVMKKIPIISVSQQNRTSTENGVGLEHIAQADRIGQDSTIVLFFEQKDGLGTLHLIKSRDSENMKKLTYLVDFNTGKFEYQEEQIADEAEAAAVTQQLLENEGNVSWT